MGRGGGRSGGSHSSGRHGGGFRSSGRSSRSGRSGGGRIGGGGGFGFGFGGPRPPRGPRVVHHYHYGPRRTVVHSSGSGAGCSSALAILVLVIILMAAIFALSKRESAVIDGDVVEQYAVDVCKEQFSEKDYGAVFVIAVGNTPEDEYISCTYRTNVADIMDDYVEYFYDAYDEYFQDDVGKQVGMALRKTAERIVRDDVTPYQGQKFSNKAYKDELDYFTTVTTLRDGMEEFYDATGIQMYVLVTKYKSFYQAYTTSTASGIISRILKVVLICATVVAVLVIAFRFWKAKKKQKNIEDENTAKILNTPLESFGDVELENLQKKYDSADEEKKE